MSSGRPLPFDQAFEVAKEAATRIRPHVVRLKAAGSLRRRNITVGDLEIVAEPRMVEADLFGTLAPDLGPLKQELESMGQIVRNGSRFIQVLGLLGHTGLALDLFLVHPPAQWGSILAIRTGPWQLGRYCVTAMKERGYAHKEGHVVRTDTGEVIPTPTEEAFFELAGVECVPPFRRDELARRLEAKGATR